MGTRFNTKLKPSKELTDLWEKATTTVKSPLEKATTTVKCDDCKGLGYLNFLFSSPACRACEGTGKAVSDPT